MVELDSKEEQAKRLKRARERRGFAKAVDGWRSVSERSKDAPSMATYLQHENGTRSLKNAAQIYARAYEVPEEWLVWGLNAPEWADSDGRDLPSAPPSLGLLPVRGEIQAGTWLEIDNGDQREPEWLPAAVDPRFPAHAQWLSLVRGDSMNALEKNGRPAGIYAGDYVHCVDIRAFDYRPKTGDVVEVERLRFDGAERELTLKQIEISGDDIVLWPRSTNPRWREPIQYRDGPADAVEVRIRGFVISVNRRFD